MEYSFAKNICLNTENLHSMLNKIKLMNKEYHILLDTFDDNCEYWLKNGISRLEKYGFKIFTPFHLLNASKDVKIDISETIYQNRKKERKYILNLTPLEAYNYLSKKITHNNKNVNNIKYHLHLSLQNLETLENIPIKHQIEKVSKYLKFLLVKSNVFSLYYILFKN